MTRLVASVTSFLGFLAVACKVTALVASVAARGSPIALTTRATIRVGESFAIVATAVFAFAAWAFTRKMAWFSAFVAYVVIAHFCCAVGLFFFSLSLV